ncbi:MAG: hypothetical protein IT426_19460 [Pirellulales bacterium]|nr:hypothetical protein [Pirellulales bacterium]
MFSGATCQICGRELREARERLLGVCLTAKCQLAWAGRLQSRRNAEMQLKMQARTRLANLHREREALLLGIGRSDAIQPVVVPANERKIANLPERRKRAFRDFLTEIISQAAALRAKSAVTPRGETALDSSPVPPELDSLLGRGCATCRGRCCNAGGDRAYLSADTILGYMHHHPEQRPRDVLESYLSLLPNKSYQDACIYQAKNGCALPREMRSKISGDFFCEELRQFQRHYYAEGKREVRFYAFEESQIVRSEPVAEPEPATAGALGGE